MSSLTKCSCVLVGGLSAALLRCPDVHAHGGIPRAYDIVVEPGNPDNIVLRSDVWGIFRTTDGGQSWSWICAEAWSGRSLETQKRSLAILPGGRALVANLFQGLQISKTGSFCDFEEVPAFEGELVQDVVVTNKTDGSLIHALTSTGGADGVIAKIWASTDQGDSWAEVGQALPLNFAGQTVLTAPSNSERIYVSGKNVEQLSTGIVQRSDDGGETWQALEVPVDIEDYWARLYAVHPTNPDVVFFWADKVEGGGGDIQPDQLWFSADGGETWAKLFQAIGNLPGFALSPDAATLTIAGPEDGVWTANVDELGTRGAEAFSRTFEGKVWGLAYDGETLLAGNDDFTAGDLPKFTFGLSEDQGSSFEPIMEICDAEIVACPADSRTQQACSVRYTEEGGFVEDFLEGPRCVAEPGAGGAAGGSGGAAGAGSGVAGGTSMGSGGAGAMDPNTMGVDDEDDGGCGVAASKPAGTGVWWAGAFGLAALFALRRRVT